MVQNKKYRPVIQKQGKGFSLSVISHLACSTDFPLLFEAELPLAGWVFISGQAQALLGAPPTAWHLPSFPISAARPLPGVISSSDRVGMVGQVAKNLSWGSWEASRSQSTLPISH